MELSSLWRSCKILHSSFLYSKAQSIVHLLGGKKRRLSIEAKSSQDNGGRSSAKKPKLSGKKGHTASNKSKFQELLGESTTQESDFK